MAEERIRKPILAPTCKKLNWPVSPGSGGCGSRFCLQCSEAAFLPIPACLHLSAYLKRSPLCLSLCSHVGPSSVLRTPQKHGKKPHGRLENASPLDLTEARMSQDILYFHSVSESLPLASFHINRMGNTWLSSAKAC